METNKSFSKTTSVPLFQQLVDYITEQIRTGNYSPDKPIPSINAMRIISGMSKETIVKAYSALCRQRILTSRQGKGFYITESFLSGRPTIMAFLDKMSQHQQSILDGFIEKINGRADINIRMHYQNPDWLSQALDESVDRYDWYLLFPHFTQDSQTRSKIRDLILRIPSEKLVILDRLPKDVPDNCGASYQSIEEDILSTLSDVKEDIVKYKRIRYLPLSISLYKDIVSDSIKASGKSIGVDVEELKDIPQSICKGDLFFVSGSRLDRNLSSLLKAIMGSGLDIGKDVGLICYNDFPLNEFILGGLTTLSADFHEMGSVAADMILNGRLEKVHCPCSLIRRRTF